MKSYVDEHHFRLVGKGWEVKNYLRRLARRESSRNLLLKEYLASLTCRGTVPRQLGPRRKLPGKMQDRRARNGPSS